MKVTAIRTKLIRPGDDLIASIRESIKRIREGSILAVTSKVVSVWEGRVIPKDKKTTLEKLVQQEAEKIWKSKYCWLALKQGILAPNAGVDESNAFGGFILWPKDSFASALRIYKALMRHYKIKKFGVLITDSWTMPLRYGVVGIALGYYGFEGQKNYMGEKDLNGRVMEITKVSVADTLASAAVFTMGEGREKTPIAIIEGAGVQFTKKTERKRLRIEPEDDIFKPVLRL